jgi:hypothetical protein
VSEARTEHPAPVWVDATRLQPVALPDEGGVDVLTERTDEQPVVGGDHGAHTDARRAASAALHRKDETPVEVIQAIVEALRERTGAHAPVGDGAQDRNETTRSAEATDDAMRADDAAVAATAEAGTGDRDRPGPAPVVGRPAASGGSGLSSERSAEIGAAVAALRSGARKAGSIVYTPAAPARQRTTAPGMDAQGLDPAAENAEETDLPVMTAESADPAVSPAPAAGVSGAPDADLTVFDAHDAELDASDVQGSDAVAAETPDADRVVDDPPDRDPAVTDMHGGEADLAESAPGSTVEADTAAATVQDSAPARTDEDAESIPAGEHREDFTLPGREADEPGGFEAAGIPEAAAPTGQGAVDSSDGQDAVRKTWARTPVEPPVTGGWAGTTGAAPAAPDEIDLDVTSENIVTEDSAPTAYDTPVSSPTDAARTDEPARLETADDETTEAEAAASPARDDDDHEDDDVTLLSPNLDHDDDHATTTDDTTADAAITAVETVHDPESPQLRPGDVLETPIAVWTDEAAAPFRQQWHEIKAQFVDDPVGALAQAQTVCANAVHDLADSLLAEQAGLDPHRANATPDTESMRIAMRRYREFLDRILAL